MCTRLCVHVCAGVRVCLHMCLHVCLDVHACICTCVHKWLWCRYVCAHEQAGACIPTCVRACPCMGVHTQRSPRAAGARGFPAPGCACGGLGPAGCSSPQQQPPLPGHEAGVGLGLHCSPTSPRLLLAVRWVVLLQRPCPQAGAPWGLGDTGADLGTFFQGKCSCVALWSRVTVLRGHLTVAGLLSPLWVLWPHLVLPAALAAAQLILPGADIPILATAPLGVAFHGGAAPAQCQPCPVPSQRAE